VRRLLRRKRSPRVVPEAAVRDSPALAQDEPAQDEPAQDEPAQDEPPQADVPRELQAEEQLVREAVDSAAETRRDHRRRVVEIEPTRVRASPDVADQRERSPRQSEVVEFESTERRSKVVEFEAPTHRRTIRTERAVPPHRRVMDDVAPLPEAEPLFAELRPPAVAEPLQSRPGAPPVPRRWPDAGPLPEPALQPPRPRPESSTRTRARTRGPDEPLVAAEIDPWPELPPRIDEPDPGVDVTLRAWERQRRLDREQTRL
jgi:hypothetical protein